MHDVIIAAVRETVYTAIIMKDYFKIHRWAVNDVPLNIRSWLWEMLADFKNSFTVGLGLSNKFATRFVSYFPLHHKCITTLPCEIQKINNSNSLDVFNSVTDLLLNLLLNISIRMLLNHRPIKFSECPPLTWTHAHRCLYHLSVSCFRHRWHFVPSHARPLLDVASLHQRHELDKCRKCFHACIHVKDDIVAFN